MGSGSGGCILGGSLGGESPGTRDLWQEIAEHGRRLSGGNPACDLLMSESEKQRLMEPWLKHFSHVQVRMELLDFAPSTEPCPVCGKMAKRHQVVDRGPIVDVSLEGPVLLMVKLGVYLCRSDECCGKSIRGGRRRSFRKPLPFTVPRGHYTLRAREFGINGVKLDGMPFSKVVKRLAREFHVAPARSTAWEWHKAHGDAVFNMIDYQKWSVESLSGVVCIDEMYDGEFCILIATDPLSKLTLGFQVLTGSIDGQQMVAFLRYLDEKGVHPDVMVTDESQLYPKALAEVWPKAKHQLCIFHIMQHVVKDVLAAVREFVKALPQDPKHKRGRPSKDEAPRSKYHTERRKTLYDGRYLFVRNPDKMSAEAREALEGLLQEHPELNTHRTFMLDTFALFSCTTTLEQARAKRTEMLANPKYQGDTNLKKALKKFEDEAQFEKMLTFVSYTNLNRTNNDVERDNRWVRKKQKSHYGLRRKTTIANALALRMRIQQQEKTTTSSPKLEPRPAEQVLQ